MWNKTISDHTIYLFRKLWFLCLASPAQLFKTSPHPNVQDSESTTSDFVTVVITAMTNLVDHFLTTSSAKLQRIDVQKAMLACNHLSRQCNKSLGDIDAFHMPHPRVSATTPAKRTQVQMPPAHHAFSLRPSTLGWRKMGRMTIHISQRDNRQHSCCCNQCDYQVSVTFREHLYHRRHKHIQPCHKGEAYKVQSVATSLPVIEASDSPALSKAWTCAKCNKGPPTWKWPN